VKKIIKEAEKVRHIACSLLFLAAVLDGGKLFAAPGDAYTFTTSPAGGSISGVAGSTIGWGYSITNQSATDWLVTTNLNAGLFINCSPNSGLFDFPIIAPGTKATEAFNLAASLGLFDLAWNPGAPVGFGNSGQFTLSAEWWSGNPLAGGTFIADAVDQNAAYSATVSAPVVSSGAPEPSVLGMLAVGVFFCIQAGRARYRARF
jgi:hypothetical protein